MTTTSTPNPLETFASIKWATPYLQSPNWTIQRRGRGTGPDEAADKYCRDTMWADNSVQQWIELHEKPAAGTTTVAHSISLVKFSIGLMGFPGIAHGGAIMTLMDEALGYAMVACEMERGVGDWNDVGAWGKRAVAGKSVAEIAEALKGYMVTAKLDVKFMKPVLCPGIVGIEVKMVEDKGHVMRMKGVMMDGEGTPLLEATGLWVRLGAAKL
ncbi:hypothetical protein P154DRAFT_523521 [Amniculicola lignicola CBS 123094]|uniref:Thioesterase domain-containing protein n=1 Tax=Amniculicola lignicola CBS 123094 TaxID=1392246 RepID=A0A6A5WB86_9PLEO|nr:hypothetical protein P154DRAFT_523521 [Amniculicola lignicola CBS 123094]